MLCYCSGAVSVLPLHKSSLGQDGSCLCPCHGQLSSAGTLHSTTPSAQGKPLGEHGAPNSISVLLALANAIALCRMHAGTGSSCCSASLSPEFLCMPQVLCVQCLKRRCEHPMAWRWGQALCLGMGSSEARVGWQFLGVTVGEDEDALWAHSHFPSQGGCFSQGVLALRQGRNGDACKLQR